MSAATSVLAAPDATAPAVVDVPLWRLHALRAAYALLVVGLGLMAWPDLVHGMPSAELMQGVVTCVLAAVALLAIAGLRHPLAMLPLLLFETVWKAIWLTVVAVPLWLGPGMDPDVWPTASACLMGVVFPIVIPWRHVWLRYIAMRGDRWR